MLLRKISSFDLEMISFDFIFFSVDTANLSASTSLLSYLRNTLRLTGTKAMCYQAGCGACMVTATFMDPSTNEIKTRAVNAVRIFEELLD